MGPVKLKVANVKGEVVGDVEVRDDVFGVPMNTALVHQVMVGQLANARQGTASTRTRAQAAGGGRKAEATEGLRPSSPGLHTFTPMERWRSRLRPQPTKLPAPHPQTNEAPSHAGRAVR